MEDINSYEEKQSNTVNNNNNTSDTQTTQTPNPDDNNNKEIDNQKEKSKENKYTIQVRNYINANSKNNEYRELLNNNPQKIFSFLNEKIFVLWQSIVYNQEITIIGSDEAIITHIPDRKDQYLIEVDAKRTRVVESSLVVGFKKYLELILTYYADTKEIQYKQGLNEIFGPLVLMKYKIEKIKLTNIFNFGEAFIDRFLPNYYYEKGLCSIKSSLSLFALLLKYHEPSIFNRLDKLEIPHELYAANWLLTLRAGKLNLDILYRFFNELLLINDPLFIHYVLVASIVNYRELLINCETNYLVKFLSNLSINSIEELNNIIKIALDLRNHTPYGFKLLANKIGFLKANNKNIEKTFEKYKPESIPALPVYPLEILQQDKNKEVISCSDPECKNFEKNIVVIDWDNNNISEIKKDKDINKEHVCEKCDLKVNKSINYILLDLRVFPPSFLQNEDNYFSLGFVSGMMAIDKEELESEDLDKLLSSHLLSIRGKNHIVLMTSKTDYFNEFEEKFYAKNNINEIEKRKMLFGMIENQKEEKKLNLIDAKNLNVREIYKLKEYDNLRRVMNSLRENNFQYVSYLEGGFEALHNECLKNKIELVSHNKNKCFLCNNTNEEKDKIFSFFNNIEDEKPNISDSLWKNKKKINVNQLDSFLLNKNNMIFFCFLRRYKTKTYHNKDFGLCVPILFDKETIEIYKKEKNNGENNQQKEENSYDKEKNKNKNFEMTFIDEIKFIDLEKIGFNQEFKNVVTMEIIKKEIKEKNIFGKIKNFNFNNKNKEKKEESFIIELEFDSFNECKHFVDSINNRK